MPSQLITNLSYKAEKFLDSRQDEAKTIEDLRTWSTPIPDGFEVYLEATETWYVYNSKGKVSPETGKFSPRGKKALDDLDNKLTRSVEENKTALESKITEHADTTGRLIGEVRTIANESKETADRSQRTADSAVSSVSTLTNKVTDLESKKLDKSVLAAMTFITSEEISNINDLLS